MFACHHVLDTGLGGPGGLHPRLVRTGLAGVWPEAGHWLPDSAGRVSSLMSRPLYLEF